MRRQYRSSQRHKRSRINRSQVAFFAVCAGILLVLFSIGKELIRRHGIASDISGLKSEITKLEQKNTDLQSFLSYLKSPTYVEEEARIKLGLQKQGESVLAVPGNGTTAPSANGNLAADSSDQPIEDRGNPERWWDFLFTHRIDT